jgi:hypothetical protein
MMKTAFIAAAALLAASAFAQGSVTSSTGASVSSGTGLAVTPGAPNTTVSVTPSTSVTTASHRLTPGGAMVQRSSTTVMGGPSGDATGTRTEITTYWANVPANAPRRHDFQRWQALK